MGVINEVQESRLRDAAQLALAAKRVMYDGLIDRLPADGLTETAHRAGAADGAFYRLLARRGLVVGDTVRVLTDGMFKGAEAEIQGFDFAHRAELLVDGTTVVVRGNEVELAAPRQER